MSPGGSFDTLVLGNQFVERLVFFVRNIFLGAGPDGRAAVEVLHFEGGNFLHFLRLFLLLGVFLVGNLQIVLFALGLFLVVGGSFLLFIFNFDLHGLDSSQINRMDDEFGIMLGQFLQSVLIGIFQRIFLQKERNFRSPGQSGSPRIRENFKFRRSIRRRPYPLRVRFGMLTGNLHAVGHQKTRVKAHTELTNLGYVSRHAAAGGFALILESLHETSRSTAGDRTKVFHQIVVRHSDSGISHDEDVLFRVEFDFDLQLVFSGEVGGICEGQESHLVEGIAGVGD
mmetsp:Transcript_33603/g.52206  ORF Transcript_33603/g.52206 Transcript_33603/m.52206 type:complete len:284 (+) Transcript_33603:1248-2099(+)